MLGIFVNENGGIHYAAAIAAGIKPIETRNKNMLAACVGQRVDVIRTRRGKKPVIIGQVDVVAAEFKTADWLDENRELTLIPPGSAYDCNGRGKWCYMLANAVACAPRELPADVTRHGRSYCEY